MGLTVCRGARPALANVARSVITGNRMLDSLSYTGDNSSYSLTFRAPQYRCSQVESEEQLHLSSGNDGLSYSAPAFTSQWSQDRNDLSFTKYAVVRVRTASSPVNATRHVTMAVRNFSCRGESHMFELDISYSGGNLSINPSTSDANLSTQCPRIWAARP
jgi:hypothetical protein